MSPTPRILALHGFRTSASVFSMQITMAGLKKELASVADVTYIDAPGPASGPAYAEVLQFFEPPFFEWWNAVQTGTGEVASGQVGDGWTYQGLAASLEHLESYMAQHGPFDGLMGFSQGASVAGLIAMLQHTGKAFQHVPKLKFVVLLAGGKCRDPAFGPMYAAAAAEPEAHGIPFPVFLMVGEEDPHKATIEAVVPCCAQVHVFRHPQGHQVARLPPDELAKLKEIMMAG
ncbi:hypothetical protein FOA52_012483 [Chlamydomonas sp. UWO 241]|nr:hypothetical protein FOA52_012483 [Chlamydomonas sp. UWO 241]